MWQRQSGPFIRLMTILLRGYKLKSEPICPANIEKVDLFLPDDSFVTQVSVKVDLVFQH